MESNARFYRRRANEELSAAHRAVTPAARDRRIDLARRFLNHLDEDEAEAMLFDWGMVENGSIPLKQAKSLTQPTFA